MARAKMELQKHFEHLPNATDAEQQAWIEAKVQLDYGRLLDRLAAQLNSEIAGISLYQIGFADFYFNIATNAAMAEVDDETLSAARMICYVLPALSESVVSYQHQNVAEALLRALIQGVPPYESFITAIFMLAQDPQVLVGLDKLLSNIFAPRTGSQLAKLARKRAGVGFDPSRSDNWTIAFSAAPSTAPLLRWKEPVTIANAARYNSHPPRAPALIQGGFSNTVFQPHYQNPAPPSIPVQAEIYRPPPPQGAYYQQPYMPSQPQSYYQNGNYQGPPPPSGWMNQGNYQGHVHGNWPAPLPYNAYPGSYPQHAFPPGQSCQQPSYQHPSYQTPTNAYSGSYQQPSLPPPSTAPATNHQITSDSRSSSYQPLDGSQEKESAVDQQITSDGFPTSYQQPDDGQQKKSTARTDEEIYQGLLLNEFKAWLLPDDELISPATLPPIISAVESCEAFVALQSSALPVDPPLLIKDREFSEIISTRPATSSRQTRNQSLVNRGRDLTPEATVVADTASNGSNEKAISSNNRSAIMPEAAVVADAASNGSSEKAIPSNNHSTVTPGAVVVADAASNRSIRQAMLSFQAEFKRPADTNEMSAIPAVPGMLSDLAPDGGLRRRSGRGPVLTSKAKAAGILLGTQVKDTGRSQSKQVSKPSETRQRSTSPEVDGELPLNTSVLPSEETNTLKTSVSATIVGNSVSSADTRVAATSFVPRSSGRERKPTAKSLASSSPRIVLRASAYSSSVPRISSKLRLSLSSKSSVSSDNSPGSKDEPSNKTLHPLSNDPDFLGMIKSLKAKHSAHGSLMSEGLTQRGILRQSMDAEQGTSADERSTGLDHINWTSSTTELGTSADERSNGFDDLNGIIVISDDDTSPDTLNDQPVVGRKMTSTSANPTHKSPSKYQNFLTNDRGQNMGQALLMMAQIATEWSDSDDGDETTTEEGFHTKLQQAVDMHMQPSKSEAIPEEQAETYHEMTPTLSPSATGLLPAVSRTAETHAASSPEISTNVRKLTTSHDPQQVFSPNKGFQNGAKHIGVEPRTIPEITDDFAILTKLADEANKYGLPLHEEMNLDDVTNIIQTCRATELDAVDIPGMGLFVLSPETRAAYANQRQTNETSYSVTSTAGSTSGSHRSTPSTRGTGSATPQPRDHSPPKPVYKKGGTVMDLGSRANWAQLIHYV